MTNYKIVVDTREKKPYKFHGYSTVNTALNAGDYSIEGFEDTFAIERKSLDDLAQTLGRGRKRFVREIRRAQDMERFVVVIEADRADLEKYRDVSGKKVPNSVYYAHTHPNSILGTVDKWPAKYPVLDFVWAKDRNSAKALTTDLLLKWAGEHSLL